MNVTFVGTYQPANCGIAVYSQYLAEALRKLCTVNVLPVITPKANPAYFIGLALKARKGADIVHVQYDCSFFGTISAGALSISGMYTPLFYLLVRGLGGPAIVTTMHELQDVNKNYSGRRIYWPMRLYYSAVYRAIDALSSVVIVHTRDSINVLSQYSANSKAEIVPLACVVRPVILPGEECKARLGLSGKRIVMIFGFISRSKGHDLAIDAIRSMPEDTVLYIAGDGRTPDDKEYVRSLKELAKSRDLEDRVIFHGYVADEDTPCVIGAADVILLPYRHVVQSSALNYALACGKAVLASDIGGFHEIYDTYRCISTFKPGDVDDLMTKLTALLTDMRMVEDLTARAGDYCSAVDVDNIALRTYNIYEKAGKSG